MGGVAKTNGEKADLLSLSPPLLYPLIVLIFVLRQQILSPSEVSKILVKSDRGFSLVFI